MRDPIRVLMAIKSLGPGGAERLVLDQIRTGAGGPIAYELFVARERRPDLLDEARALGVPIHLAFETGRSWPLALRSVARNRRFDVVHSHLPMTAVGARWALVGLGARRPALVYTEHNRWPSHHRLTRWLNRATIWRDDLVIAVSRDAGASIGWPAPRPIRVIQHGVELPAVDRAAARLRLRDELEASHQTAIVGTVANLRREKAQADLLAAFARASPSGEAILVIVGQGPLEGELRRAGERLGLGDRVRFLGYRSDAVEVMAGFDLFALPSAHEGRPVALMEAMSLGLPVVVTPVGGITDMVEDGTHGRVVSTGDVSALATALAELLADEPERTRLGAAAARAAEAFDARAAFAEIEAHYQRLATRP